MAEVLGIDPFDVRAVTGDTDLTPVDLGSYSSRVTLMMGNAAIQAAERARDMLADGGRRASSRCRRIGWCSPSAACSTARTPIAASRFAEAVCLAEARVRHDRHHRLVHAAEVARRSSRAAASGRRRPTPTPPRSSRWRSIPTPAGSPCRGSGSRTTSAARSIPTLVRGQVEGSVYMGLGEALMEEQAFRRLPPRLSHALVHKFPSMLEYKSPTRLDMPEIFTELVEHPDPAGPVRREGSRAGAAAADHAGGGQRGVRRGRRAHRRDAGHAGEDPEGAAGEGGRASRRATARRRFPTSPWPEPLLVAPPWEGGDGRASNEPSSSAGRRRDGRGAASRRRRGVRVMMRLPPLPLPRAAHASTEAAAMLAEVAGRHDAGRRRHRPAART